MDAVGHGSARTAESKGDRPPLFGRSDDDGGRRLRQLQIVTAAEKEVSLLRLKKSAEYVKMSRALSQVQLPTHVGKSHFDHMLSVYRRRAGSGAHADPEVCLFAVGLNKQRE